MSIIISGFGHVLVATNEQIVLLLAGLWLIGRGLGAGETWLRNRYEWSPVLWRPVRRWYAAGATITGVDQRKYHVLDFDVNPEQLWVRVVDDEADEDAESRWEPISKFMQPIEYAQRIRRDQEVSR